MKMRKYGSILLGFMIYAIVAAASSGVLIIIDLFFARFRIFIWFNKFVRKQIFFNTVRHHPTIKSLESEGYEFGMPT